MRRVVVTGMGGLTALGGTWPQIRARMEAGETGIRRMHEWDRLSDLNTKIGGAIDWFDHAAAYHRKKARSMGASRSSRSTPPSRRLPRRDLRARRCSIRAVWACRADRPSARPSRLRDFATFMETGKAGGLNATSYIRMMSHTTAVNIGIYFGLTGASSRRRRPAPRGRRESDTPTRPVREGHADIMLAGGAEQLCPTMAVVFDTLFATSTRNDSPATASRPYDKTRDGLVIGEGAAILVLEELDHALARGAVPLAEIVGFATNSDGAHITQPRAETQVVVMRNALNAAGLSGSDIDFISGHGTATDTGDVAESLATAEVYGDRTPIHSLKGHFGHTLGACGAIEAWLTICMMRDRWFPPTANLDEIDPRCATLDYIMHEPRGSTCGTSRPTTSPSAV